MRANARACAVVTQTRHSQEVTIMAIPIALTLVAFGALAWAVRELVREVRAHNRAVRHGQH